MVFNKVFSMERFPMKLGLNIQSCPKFPIILYQTGKLAEHLRAYFRWPSQNQQ